MDPYYKTAPTIIIEVLSKTTRKFDQTLKRLRCKNIPSLQEYVLIEQDKGEIQLFSRAHNWQSFYYYLGDRIRFASLEISIAVEDIYERVDNEDLLSFLEQEALRSATQSRFCADRRWVAFSLPAQAFSGSG